MKDDDSCNGSDYTPLAETHSMPLDLPLSMVMDQCVWLHPQFQMYTSQTARVAAAFSCFVSKANAIFCVHRTAIYIRSFLKGKSPMQNAIDPDLDFWTPDTLATWSDSFVAYQNARRQYISVCVPSPKDIPIHKTEYGVMMAIVIN